MTISDGTTNKEQITSGSTITITDLEIQDDTQVTVIKTDTSVDPNVETTLALTTDYTINSDLDTITLLVALVTDEEATAVLNIPNTQLTDYNNFDDFNVETVETLADKITLKNKQQDRDKERSVKFVETETNSSDILIPDVSGNTDKYLKLNAAETAFEWAALADGTGLGNIIEDISPQLGGQLDVNGQAIGDGTNELITFTEDASAVNNINIENEATGSGPILSPAGDDTNIDLNLNGKNTGNVILRDGTDVTKKLSVELSGATTAKTTTLASSQTDNRTITLPDATDTLVGKDTTDTLTNKTLVTPVLGTPASGDLSNCTNINTAGNAVQIVNVQDGAVATGTTTMDVDDTIPQNTEGDEYMTLAITPTSASNKLKIDVIVQYSESAADSVVCALFQDSTVDALAGAVGAPEANTGNKVESLVFTHYMTAGTTSATTFKIRGGVDTSGTFTFNGQASNRLLGGIMASSITITEIKV